MLRGSLLYNVAMFNTVDWIILVLCAIGAIWGAIKGFIDEFAQKSGYIAGILVALMFTSRIYPVIEESLRLPVWVCSLISYVGLFIVGFLLIKMLGAMLKKITDTARLSFLDNILGFVLGLAESIVIVGIFEILLSYQNLFDLSLAFSRSFFSSRVIMPLFNIVSTHVQDLV